jgi:hypothetical protein
LAQNMNLNHHKLWYHHHPVKLICRGPAGYWFEHMVFGERFLVPVDVQAGMVGTAPCISSTPRWREQGECRRCGCIGFATPRQPKQGELFDEK